MNAVSKNIKRLRKRDAISQEILADKLNVTRQAVSSWETGKTQPGIDMLISIAAAFDVDVTEVIYGEKQAAPTVQNKKKYKLAAIIFGSITFIFILQEIFLVPYLRHLSQSSYIAYPILIYMYLICPASYSCVSLAFFNALSLAYDLRIKKQMTRKMLAAVSLFLLGLYCLTVANAFLGIFPNYMMFDFAIPLIKNPGIFIIPGTALFFGFNK